MVFAGPLEVDSAAFTFREWLCFVGGAGALIERRGGRYKRSQGSPVRFVPLTREKVVLECKDK